ncbi:hypothetical protein BKH43_02505 [Helicobacter sp. 13S00401-1]|uniref:hypothetical protein n=1 Tax=Helicobacter sp. 13S00401-1 TaxID=1905758 RepID=UPI000BA74353|nr:hypothetical protein [Helicobacter sp. 13S00401-1]PAF51096.1 hypothetical protein BKH43_02505 [Helicobacter sp. 13S00401-1]
MSLKQKLKSFMLQNKDYIKPLCHNFILNWHIDIGEDDALIKTFKIFGISIFRRVISKNYIKDYRGAKLVKTLALGEDYKKSMLEEYARLIKNASLDIKNYKAIFIFNSNSGEINLFLTYVLKPLLKRYNLDGYKDLLFIATKDYHLDIMESIFPQVPRLLAKNIKLFYETLKYINKQAFFTIFTSVYFLKVEDNIAFSSTFKTHYFKLMLKELDIDKKDLVFQGFLPPQNIESSMLAKIKKTKLNLKNFIILAPEAISCKPYKKRFWKKLIKSLQAAGIDIFVNAVEKSTHFKGVNYKHCKLGFDEVFMLAKLSLGVVSLRSGLVENLLQANVPLFALYTRFKHKPPFGILDSKKILAGFSLRVLPNINQTLLYEFDMEEVVENKLIELIVYIASHKKEKLQWQS